MPNVPEIVAHPLGLVGFLLALVFALAARRRVIHGWVRPLIYMLCFVVALGGLGLAYYQTARTEVRGVLAARTPSASSAAGQSPVAVASSAPAVSISVPNNQGQVVGVVQGNLSIDARGSRAADMPASGASVANP